MSNLVHIDGKAFVLVPVHEYRRLLNGNASDTSETLPGAVLDLLTAREQHPVKILRRFRGMTQAQLAASSGLSRPYLTEIETGRKPGSISTLKSIANALNVSVNLIID